MNGSCCNRGNEFGELAPIIDKRGLVRRHAPENRFEEELMKKHACTLLGIVALLFACHAQAQESPLTASELKVFRHLVFTLGEPDWVPQLAPPQASYLMSQFGLNQAEMDVIQSARLTLSSLMFQLHQAGVSGPTSTDLEVLQQQRDASLEQLANLVINSVRPETAARLRAPARIVSAIGNRAPGGN